MTLAWLTLLALAAQDAPRRSDWTIRGRLAPEEVVVQSHRGAGLLAPENTLEAFDLAWSLGTVPEADLRMTKDGVIVAFHDDTFARVVRNADPALKKKGVADLTWDELAALDVGEGLRAARLEPVFERMKDAPARTLYLDVKKVSLPRVAELARAAGVESRLVLASPRHAQLREWRKLVPTAGALLWMGGTEEELLKRLEELRSTSFAELTQLQVHVRRKPGTSLDGPDPFTLSDAFLIELGRELRERKIVFQVLPWGGADAAVYARLLDLGVMSFATDYPKVTMEAVRRYLAER